MDRPSAVSFLLSQRDKELEKARKLSLCGWPAEANYHRRKALWCIRQLRKFSTA